MPVVSIHSHHPEGHKLLAGPWFGHCSLRSWYCPVHKLKLWTPIQGCFSAADTNFQPSEDVTLNIQVSPIHWEQGGVCWALGWGQAQERLRSSRLGDVPQLYLLTSGRLHRPARGQVARTDFFVLSKADLHSSRILEKKLYLLDTHTHWWGEARSTTLGWTLLPQPPSVWAAHFPAACLLLGLVREGLAGPLLPDLPVSPASNLNKHRRKHSCLFPEKTFQVFQYSPAKIPLGKGGDRVLWEVRQYQWPPHLYEHGQNVPQDKCVLTPCPPKNPFTAKNSLTNTDTICCLGNLIAKD